MATIRAVVALMLLMSCETTRVNNEKPTARALICNVPDRCGITP